MSEIPCHGDKTNTSPGGTNYLLYKKTINFEGTVMVATLSPEKKAWLIYHLLYRLFYVAAITTFPMVR